MFSIFLSGASGRAGQEIQRVVEADPELAITGRATSAVFFEADALADVLIDFSAPALTEKALILAVQRGIPMVIGTTGLSAGLQQLIGIAAQRIPICQAANFSIGVNLMLDLVERAAAGLPESFDIEIAETHHRWKVDAPSGTALALGGVAAAARGLEHERAAAVRGNGARKPGQIGYQVRRGGDVAGEHTVLFLGDGERLELTHRATDRAIFARGALHAARWLCGRPPGLYSMRDLLRE